MVPSATRQSYRRSNPASGRSGNRVALGLLRAERRVRALGRSAERSPACSTFVRRTLHGGCAIRQIDQVLPRAVFLAPRELYRDAAVVYRRAVGRAATGEAIGDAQER